MIHCAAGYARSLEGLQALPEWLIEVGKELEEEGVWQGKRRNRES